MRLWLLLLLALPLIAQLPSFESASIRRSYSGERISQTLCQDLRHRADDVGVSAVTRLDGLVKDAYRDEVEDFDLPDWVADDGPFTVEVKMKASADVHACRKMLQKLLVDRFHLVTQIEIRDVPRFHLKVAETGLKLIATGPPVSLKASYDHVVEGDLETTTFRGAPASSVLSLIVATAEANARVRRGGFRIVGVVNETGLSGYYTGKFIFAPEAVQFTDLTESLEDALTRQLGLALEFRKSPGKVLILKAADSNPSEN